MRQPNDNRLEAYLSTLLKPKTAEQLKQSNYFFAYNKRLLIQNYLADVDPNEVLDEAVLRLIKYKNKHEIEESQEIKSYEALLKRISLNVIREMSRKQRLKKRVDYESMEHQLTSNESSTEQVYQSLDAFHLLESFWQQLSIEEREILGLRAIEELSWETISRLLSDKGVICTLSSLRKRYERVVKRLRQKMG